MPTSILTVTFSETNLFHQTSSLKIKWEIPTFGRGQWIASPTRTFLFDARPACWRAHLTLPTAHKLFPPYLHSQQKAVNLKALQQKFIVFNLSEEVQFHSGKTTFSSLC